MKNTIRTTRSLLADSNPVPDQAFSADWDDDGWQAEFERILATPPGLVRPRVRMATRRGAAAAVLAAAVAAAVAIALVGGGSAHHGGSASGNAWPPMLRYTLAGVTSPVTAADLPSARAVLLHLAQVAGRQRPTAAGPGADVGYTKAIWWYGPGSSVTSRGLSNGPPDVDSVETWTEPDGAVQRTDCDIRGGCSPDDSQTYSAADRIHAGYGPLAGTLSTSPAMLRAQLLSGRVDQYPEPASQELMRTIAGGIAAQVIGPALQAALWRVLAGQPDIRYMGTVTDRAGRPGVAVDFLGGFLLDRDTRYVLIISPVTGRLLGEEEIRLTEHSNSSGRLRRGGGSAVVASYFAYVAQGWTTRLGAPAR